jgi:hypothetical protein
MDGNVWIPAVLPFLPESPRQLIAKGRTDQATAALTKIYGKSVPESFVQSELLNIKQGIEITKRGTYRELFQPHNRKPLIICKLLDSISVLLLELIVISLQNSF